ncbi:MAG: hypothetical protein IPK78_19850 [Rhodospirillales bacterium]|nr:hypothetical protein [Rhodospirillales bacterium]
MTAATDKALARAARLMRFAAEDLEAAGLGIKETSILFVAALVAALEKRGIDRTKAEAAIHAVVRAACRPERPAEQREAG